MFCKVQFNVKTPILFLGSQKKVMEEDREEDTQWEGNRWVAALGF